MAPAIDCQQLGFRYRPEGPPVLDGVSLQVGGTDFLGLIGPNGGGKTTLLRILLGLLRPSGGSVRLFGQTPERAARRVGYVPQHARIDRDVPHTAREVVLTGRLGRSPWGFRYARAHREQAAAMLEQVGLADLAERRIKELSGGQRQRVLIARALAAEAELLIMDEPMTGVDTMQEGTLMELLHRLNRQMPVILVSHDLGFVSRHVTQVACLNRTLVVHDVAEMDREALIAHYGGEEALLHLHHHHGCCPAEDGAGGDGA